jgi:hypothetical protein
LESDNLSLGLFLDEGDVKKPKWVLEAIEKYRR